MTAPERASETGRRLVDWLGIVSLAAVVAGWLALVLHYQYRIAWPGDYEVAADVLFLAGVAGLVLTRSAWRWV